MNEHTWGQKFFARYAFDEPRISPEQRMWRALLFRAWHDLQINCDLKDKKTACAWFLVDSVGKPSSFSICCEALDLDNHDIETLKAEARKCEEELSERMKNLNRIRMNKAIRYSTNVR